MKRLLAKIIGFTYGSIMRRLVLHTSVAVLVLLSVIAITIWSANTLTMITAIARFERTHTVSRVEAMVALLKYVQFKQPAALETFNTKMELTQSYNRVFSRLLEMRETTPDAEFIQILEQTFAEADHQTAVIIVNRIKVLYWHPFLVELVSFAAQANASGEKIKRLVAQLTVAENESAQRALFAEIEKVEQQFSFLETSFSKRCSDLAQAVAVVLNYVLIALLLLCIVVTCLLTYLIAKAFLRQVVTYTSDLEQQIRERNLAEEELRQSEATFRKLFEDSADAILLIDATGVFVECNQAALNRLKMTREQFLFSPPTRISPEFQPDGRRSAETAPEMIKLAYSKGLHRFDWTCLNAEGSEFIVEVSLMPITIKGQTMLHTAWRDITERKRAEAEKIKLETQLQQARKIESIGQLAGGVAHDFNNMLGVILGHVELALMKAEPGNSFIPDLVEIRIAAKRSADLTRQLLTFARKQTVVPKVLNLNETVTGMLQMLQRLIGEHIVLAWHPAENLWPVKMDPSQFDQILANLCVNARDAISGTGKVTIRTGNVAIDTRYCILHPEVEPGDYVRLTLSDDGKGMDKETQAHIFEPFFTTKGIGEGTGLGLATVDGAVRQNHGFITLYSEPGLGTIFNIYLPRSESELPAIQEANEKPLRKGTETILLVEDDEMLLQLTATMLEESGYSVLPAALPSIALTLTEQHPDPIQLLITDVIMPEMNGKKLSEHLLARRPDLKVLFMSGYTADVISAQGFIEEGIHFLQKPLSFEILTAKVRELLDS